MFTPYIRSSRIRIARIFSKNNLQNSSYSIFSIITSLILAISILTIGSLSIGGTAQTQDFRGEDDLTIADTLVELDRTEPITLFFNYGSRFTDIDISNAVATLSIDNPSLEFDTTAFEDFYYGDPTRSDGLNSPEDAQCDQTYNGIRYNITDTLASSNSLVYGLQTARDNVNPSGQATGTLRERHTGCIKVDLYVSDNAQPGETVRVIFDEDSQESPDYRCDAELCNRPVRQIVEFTMAGTINDTVPTVTFEKLSSAPANVDPGDTITYTLRISNTGTVDTNNILVTDDIDADVQFSGENTCTGFVTQCSYNQTNRRLTWNVDNVPAGQTAELSFEVTVNTSTQ
jgi:uncharacterized repeat protein (TIGR01451 family)